MLRSGEVKGCPAPPLLAVDAALAAVDGAIAALAFLQLLRIHLRNQQLGWTRQKIFHLVIGSSNIGYSAFFIFSLLATCGGWQCWLDGCGFFLMACPQILFVAAFLLLLSFWVDLCHQEKDDEEDDEHGTDEALLERSKSKPGPPYMDGRRCCSFRNIRIGSRQKFVVVVIMMIFVFMIAFALLSWSGRGKDSISSSLMARVYQIILSVAMLLLGGALACYGIILFSKMSKVRSEMASTEMWKVASLAAVTLVCFTSSSVLALITKIPVLYCWRPDHSDCIINSVFLFLYYFIGSSVPSGFVLWIMRDMPAQVAAQRPEQSTIVTFVRDTTTAAQYPQWRTAVESSQSKALKASPI